VHALQTTRPITHVMRPPRVAALPHLQLSAAYRAMEQESVPCLPVLNDAHQVIGLLTRRALRLTVLGDPQQPHAPMLFSNATAATMMSPPPTCSPELSFSDALQAMLRGGQEHLLVVDSDNTLLGVLTHADLVAALGDASAEALQ